MQGTWTAIGEIDLATAPAFKGDLYDAIDTSDTEVVLVDCSGLTLIDSAGFHTLVEATEYASRHGHRLEIHNMSRSCSRLLRLCDCDSELHLEPGP